MEPFVFLPIFLIIVPLARGSTTYNKFIKYKNLIESFPSSFIAGKFGFTRQNYFSLAPATRRELPEVHFTGYSVHITSRNMSH